MRLALSVLAVLSAATGALGALRQYYIAAEEVRFLTMGSRRPQPAPAPRAGKRSRATVWKEGWARATCPGHVIRARHAAATPTSHARTPGGAVKHPRERRTGVRASPARVRGPEGALADDGWFAFVAGSRVKEALDCGLGVRFVPSAYSPTPSRVCA